MQRIVVAANGISGSPHALDFACYLGRLTNSKISGFLWQDPDADSSPNFYGSAEMAQGNQRNSATSNNSQPDVATIDHSSVLFKNACEKRGVRYSIRRIKNDQVNEIIRESRYADIVIAEVEGSIHSKAQHVIKELLENAECPVVIAPESFEGIDEVVFTYNGTRSSMYAIKQFCYLFPQLDDKKVTVIEVDEEGVSSQEEIDKFREWISGHYSSIGYTVLKGDTETELFAALLRKKNAFIVMGAYGRGRLSRFFKHSRADLLVKTLTQAILITHT